MMYQSDISLLGQLDAAARVERDELVKYNLNLCKNELWDAFRRFESSPTGDNLVALNGHWSHGVRLLTFATPQDINPRPGAGLREPARLAA